MRSDSTTFRTASSFTAAGAVLDAQVVVSCVKYDIGTLDGLFCWLGKLSKQFREFVRPPRADELEIEGRMKASSGSGERELSVNAVDADPVAGKLDWEDVRVRNLVGLTESAVVVGGEVLWAQHAFGGKSIEHPIAEEQHKGKDVSFEVGKVAPRGTVGVSNV